MSQKLVIFEFNEVPLRLLRYYAKIKPSSSIAHLLEHSLVINTLVDDVDTADLYPSQTWASFNTGVSYQEHQVHWYNDPKPNHYPLYWRIAADAQLSIGLVNTLHSSPASKYINNSNYKFVIPDCFASDNSTIPAYYHNFQALNIKATNSNSRVTTLEIPFKELVYSLPSFCKFGITSETILNGASLMFNIFIKKIPKERLRCLQFPLLADIFLFNLEESHPTLSIFFTNHVAANMHRYWYALFPDDYSDNFYDPDWVDKYKNEIITSLNFSDKFLQKLINFCRENDSILMISSSMGQTANQKLDRQSIMSETFNSRLFNVNQFIEKLTTRKFSFEIRNEMWPQCSLEFSNLGDAADCLDQLEHVVSQLENISILSLGLSANIVTFTVVLDNSKESYTIRGLKFSAKELGFVRFKVDDHHSGCHYPEGSLIIFNSKTAHSPLATVNYLEYAPAILAHFDLPKPDYMLDPTFQI